MKTLTFWNKSLLLGTLVLLGAAGCDNGGQAQQNAAANLGEEAGQQQGLNQQQDQQQDDAFAQGDAGVYETEDDLGTDDNMQYNMQNDAESQQQTERQAQTGNEERNDVAQTN